MQTIRVLIKPLGDACRFRLPAYATADSAGMDLSAAMTDPVTLSPGEFRTIACGFALALPEGFEAQVRPRSGLAARHGVTVLNAPGTIDSDYRGEVKVILINHGSTPFVVEPGMRIAQMIVAPVVRVEWTTAEHLSGTGRAEGGFGHTGR